MDKRITLLASVLIVLLILLSTVVVLVPRILNISPYIVQDEEMAPNYHKGGMIFIEEEDPEKILVGDIITYFENQGENVKTRRVMAIDKEANGFFVKGDVSRQMEIGMVHERNLIGQPVFFVPYLGFLLRKEFVELAKILLLLMAIALTVISVLVQRDRLKKPLPSADNKLNG